MNDTDKLRLVIYSENKERSLFPEKFISAIRDCLDTGMTCEQISKTVLLCSYSNKLDNIDLKELVERTLEVSHMMVNLKSHQLKK